jgi:membrane protease YdiL (CAAX protease family)
MKNIFLNKDNRLKSAWWLVVFFSLLLIILFPAILLYKNRSGGVPLSVQALMLGVVTLACQLLRKEPITKITGKLNLTFLKQGLAGILTGALLMLVPAVILTVLGMIHWQFKAFSADHLLAGVLLFAWVAVAEELLFRGFIFQRLIESIGIWPAQLIIAGLFLLTHLNNPGMTGTVRIMASINIFLASVMFGLAFIKTKSLALPLSIHFMANLMQGTILGFGVSGNEKKGILNPVFTDARTWLTGGKFGLEASLPGLLVLVVVTWFLYKNGHKTHVIN